MGVLVILGLLGSAALLLFLPLHPRGPDQGAEEGIWPSEAAFLRGGADGAVRTALAGLFADGLIESGGRTGLRRTLRPLPSGGDPVRRAVYGAMQIPAPPKVLAARPAVHRALETMIAGLVGAGLVAGRARRWLGRALLVAAVVPAVVFVASDGRIVPLVVAAGGAAGLWALSRRTIAGHRVLRGARSDYAELLAAWSPGDDPALVVAGGVALGRERDLLAAGFPVDELDKITESAFDRSGGEVGFPYLHGGYGAP